MAASTSIGAMVAACRYAQPVLRWNLQGFRTRNTETRRTTGDRVGRAELSVHDWE